MKGIVFTEFLDMATNKYGENIVDDAIELCDLPSGGAYTAAGIYDCREFIDLAMAMSKILKIEKSDLLFQFGHFLFFRFTQMMPHFFVNTSSSFELLESLDQYIHIEVKKLYPEAELPKFTIVYPIKNMMFLTYKSVRPMSDMATGLINGCIEYYGENISVEYEDKNTETHFIRIFLLSKKS